VFSKMSHELVLPIEIKCIGNFSLREGAHLGENEFMKQVELQLVPQLLPYVRETLSMVSTMSLAVPLILPTMDVIQSIRANKECPNDGTH
ncbi:hypothetical protein ACQQ91_09560, partial [Selenomonas bovis]